MKKPLLLLAALALPALARPEVHPSKLSLGIEGGRAASGLGSQYGTGRLYGTRLRYDIDDRWGVAAHFQSRTYKKKADQTQRTVIQPVTVTGFYNLRAPDYWTPYAFLGLGLGHNRRTVFSVTRTDNKPCWDLGLGAELNFLTSYSVAIEVAHRSFAGGSDGGHQVTENGVALVLNFRLPDDWVPIRPPAPLKIPDMDDPDARGSAPPLPDVEKRQAQLELDKVQEDIRARKVPPIHFETGQAVLLKASYETLDIVGTILRRYPAFSVVITGHTDEVGTKEDNEILSLARAEVVRTYLVQNFGLPSDKLTAQGAGESAPMADNTTEEGRFLNRRVEFTIQP
jgi:outer membrane protein OmpA-like peptidoglycan-associated protein/opacity protein-like surface antigen